MNDYTICCNCKDWSRLARDKGICSCKEMKEKYWKDGVGDLVTPSSFSCRKWRDRYEDRSDSKNSTEERGKDRQEPTAKGSSDNIRRAGTNDGKRRAKVSSIHSKIQKRSAPS